LSVACQSNRGRFADASTVKATLRLR
jgi:hypothetical protein